MSRDQAATHVRLMTVNGIRSRRAGVVAFVDETRVTWNPHTRWGCQCGGTSCAHVDAVRALIDPRILGEDRNATTT